MRLFEHPDFEAIVVATREHMAVPGLTEQLVEKDYYVTEVLRIVAATLPSQSIFKGGTSLSKGWDIVRRFSEDVDLFVDPRRFDPPLGKNGINTTLKRLKTQVEAHPALQFLKEESRTIGGSDRKDPFRYPQRFGGIAAVKDTVVLEAGTASGREPVEVLDIESHMARFLRETGIDLPADDLAPFPMRVMHFRRTFVEKLFTIHSKVEIYREGGPGIGTYARHYYDLFCLLQRPEVPAMLRSSEYGEIREDYREVSRVAYPRDYREPEGMSFSKSEAIFPSGDLRRAIEADYESQCRNLCYGPFPSYTEVLGAFEGVRALL